MITTNPAINVKFAYNIDDEHTINPDTVILEITANGSKRRISYPNVESGIIAFNSVPLTEGSNKLSIWVTDADASYEDYIEHTTSTLELNTTTTTTTTYTPSGGTPEVSDPVVDTKNVVFDDVLTLYNQTKLASGFVKYVKSAPTEIYL